MKPVIGIAVALVIVVGIAGVFRVGGCSSTPRTRIAQKKLYDGPSTLPVNATEWPKYLGPRGDGFVRDANLAEKWPKDGPPQLWSAEVGIGYASPVAAGGRVYLFTMNDGVETLTCFDANSGRILWSKEGGKGRSSSYPGTRATPTIDGGDIFTLGGTGELACRDVANGDARWTLNILSATGASPLDWGVASSPLVSGNLVFVQVGNGGPVALAVDRKTGQVAWKSEAKNIAGYAEPILADVEGSPQLIVFGGKQIYGMDPNSGQTLWEHPHNTSYDVHASTPIYRDGRLFVTAGYSSGSLMLELHRDAKPKELWQSKFAQSRFQPAIVDGDVVYVNSEGKFTCLGWTDGRLVWQDEDNKLKLGLGGSFLRIAPDRMIALSERGRLSLAKVTPKGVELISSGQVVEGTEVWAMPLIYAGRAYVKGQQEFVCLDISGGNAPSTQQVSVAR